MRGIATLLLTSALLYPWHALADPSADLVFCSRLPSKEERVSCYDAAARIAATKPPSDRRAKSSAAVSPAAAYAAIPTKAAPPPVVAPSPFAGYYVGVGGSMATSEPRDYFVTSTPLGVLLAAGSEQPQGWSALAAIGYNVQLGSFVTGLELRGRFGDERDNSVSTNLVPVPAFHEFKTDATVHLTAKVGAAFNDTMIFGYAGAGAARTVETTRLLAPVVGVPSAIETTQWQPSVLFGTGLERSLGHLFGRVTAEAEGVKGPAGNEDFFWTARASGMIGYRF